jgi:hypothetical protein
VRSVRSWQSRDTVRGRTNPGIARYAAGINDEGVVVVTYDDAQGRHPFVYTAETGVTDLNALLENGKGLVIEEALAVNNVGEILAYGTTNGVSGCLVLWP